MISYSKTIRTAAMLCTILTVGLAVGQDGVVRMSDRSGKAASKDGVVRMRPQQQRPQVKPASHSQDVSTPVPDLSYSNGDSAGCGLTPSCSVPSCEVPTCAAPICEAPVCEAEPDCAAPACMVPQPNCGYCPQTDVCVGESCCDVCESECCTSCDSGCECGWDTGCDCDCDCESCYSTTDCNQVFSGGRRSGTRACRHGRGGRNRRHWQGSNTTLFARCVDSGTGYGGRDCYHGQAMSFRNKNARLANRLFGWMIPSGCGGQGCPPIGKYHMTYADQPDYINPNDTQIYAAQGYGMPITVPLAPNVNHAYNYSAGIPASRITTIGTYNPQTSPQRLPHQTW